MSESIWWPDEPWWERKSLALGFVTLSFRQLGTLTVAFLAAFLLSLLFTFPIAGVSFGGRAAAFCGVFGLGYVISSRRVKLLAVELQAFYFLRTRVAEKVRRGQPTGGGESSGNSAAENHLELTVQMSVEDFKNPAPLVVADWVGSLQNETKAQFFVDDDIRMVDIVSPLKPRYRFVYVPLPEDIGDRRLGVRLEGSTEPLVSFNLLLKGIDSQRNEPITRLR